MIIYFSNLNLTCFDHKSKSNNAINNVIISSSIIMVKDIDVLEMKLSDHTFKSYE